MHVDPHPPPVITIVDPAHPGPLRDLVDGSEQDEVTQLSAVQVLAGALSALLLVGLLAVVVQSRDRAEASRITQQALDGVRVSLGVSGLSNDARHVWVGYDVVSTGPEPVELVSAAVDGVGWRVAEDLPQRLTSGATISLGLTHDLDCTRPSMPQPVLSVTVEVRGQTRVKAVRVPRDIPPLAGRLLDAVCGHIDAPQAVINSSGVARRVGDHLVVDLELINSSVHPVRVLAARVDGMELTGLRLPLPLPARPPGPFDLDAGVIRQQLRFELRLAECRSVSQAAYGQPTSLWLTASSRGETGTAFVAVAELDLLHRELLKHHCR